MRVEVAVMSANGHVREMQTLSLRRKRSTTVQKAWVAEASITREEVGVDPSLLGNGHAV